MAQIQTIYYILDVLFSGIQGWHSPNSIKQFSLLVELSLRSVGCKVGQSHPRFRILAVVLYFKPFHFFSVPCCNIIVGFHNRLYYRWQKLLNHVTWNVARTSFCSSVTAPDTREMMEGTNLPEACNMFLKSTNHFYHTLVHLQDKKLFQAESKPF